MASPCRIQLAVIGLLGILIQSDALAADWPQWRGAAGDARVTQFTPPPTWPKQLTEKWKVTVGSGDATPALVGDRLYVFSRQGPAEITRCLDANSGKEIWSDRYEPGITVSGPAAGHPGPRSSPAVAEGKVITLGVSGVLSCLDARSGKVLWRKTPYHAWPQFYTASSPLIIDNIGLVELGGRGNGSVSAFDLSTGEDKWKTETSGPAYASPAIMTAGGVKQVVVQTDKELTGLAWTDGKLLWHLAAAPRRMSQNAVTPVIDNDVVIYSGQGTGTAAIRIEKHDGAFEASPLWTNPDLSSGFATPVLKDNALFGLSNSASFFCLDAKTGKTLWVGPKRRGERGFGSIIDAGQTLLALTPSAELIAFAPNTQEFSQLASIKVPDAQPYAYPVISGIRIFIKGQDAVSLCMME